MKNKKTKKNSHVKAMLMAWGWWEESQALRMQEREDREKKS